MSQTTTHKTRSPDSILYDAIAHYPFDLVASVGTSTPVTTVQGQLPLAVTSKIMAVTISYASMNGGGALFNLVVGGGVYEGGTTAGVIGKGTFTITGSPLTGQNNTYTMNSVVIACPQTTGNSVTQQAAADTIILNNAAGLSPAANAWANTTTPEGYSFSAAAGVITYSANAYGPVYDITPTVTTGSGGDAIAVAAATGGVLPNPMPTVAQPDQFWLTGGRNYAATGNAVFATDQSIQSGFPYAAQFFGNPTDQFDVLYQQGQDLTLRVYTNASTAITNLKAVALVKPLDVDNTHPVRTNFSPVNNIR
jgi:hypothetical protein